MATRMTRSLREPTRAASPCSYLVGCFAVAERLIRPSTGGTESPEAGGMDDGGTPWDLSRADSNEFFDTFMECVYK